MDDNERNEMVLEYQRCAAANNHIITVFLLSSNREKYIGYAIESILRQTFSQFCLVILDNYSKDSTDEIVKQFDDDRLFFIKKESPLPGSNFQYAFTICSTKFMTVFHDDDIIDEEYLSMMLKKMQHDNKIVLLSPSAYIINAEGIITGKPRNYSGQYKYDSYFKHFFMRTSEMASPWFPANMYRTSFYKKELFIGYDDVGPAQDQYIVMQSERYNGVVEVISDRLIKYRVHNNQGSSWFCGCMEMQLLKFLFKDEYYRAKVIKYKRYLNKYIVSAYKGIVLNYVNNGNKSIKTHLRMEKELFSIADFKARMMMHICNISYYFFDLTIVPLSWLLRLKR